MKRPAAIVAITVLALSAVLGSYTASAQEGGKDMANSVPAPEALLALVRTNLLALDHACRTKNFTVLRDLSGPFLRSKLSAEALASSFANVCASKIDLVAVAIVTPTVTEPPSILSNGMLRLVGYFVVRPSDLHFEMLFEAAAGEWSLAGMNVTGKGPDAGQPEASKPAAKAKSGIGDGKASKKP